MVLKGIDSLRGLILAALFVALMAVVGQIAIPIPPVPVTLQTLAVMLAGSVLGRRFGTLSMLVFILLAAVGVPVLSGGSAGFGVLMGPTAGFIWTWPLAAFLIGWMTEKSRNLNGVRLTIYHFVFGVILVHMVGVMWMWLGIGMDGRAALLAGSLPFIPGDIVKALLGAVIALKLHKVLTVPGREKTATSRGPFR